MSEPCRTRSCKVMAFASLASLALFAAPAAAQDGVAIAIKGTLPESCSASVPGDQTIDPASSQVQPIGTTGVSCNFSGITTIRFWSAGSGKLTSPANSGNGNVVQYLPYQLTYDGSVIGQLTGSADTATALTRTLAATTPKQGEVAIQITSPASIAGTYADTIYLTVSP